MGLLLLNASTTIGKDRHCKGGSVPPARVHAVSMGLLNFISTISRSVALGDLYPIIAETLYNSV
jgi:hypothetical protein